MVSSTVLLFFLSAIFMLAAQAVTQPAFLYHFCIYDKGNYTANSAYEENLNHLLPSLSSNTEIDYGFYNSSYGQNSNEVHAIGLCRGDVNPDVCHGCLNNAASLLTERCPQQKEAIGWYDECMLRYSNRSILGVMETSPSFFMPNPNNVSANYVDQFNDDLRTLVESLRSKAAAGGPHLKFAAGYTTAPNFQTLYALEQCTPDLSEQDCNNCLLGAFQEISQSQCCDGKDGGRVLRPSCNIRFEVYPFFDGTIAASPRPVDGYERPPNPTPMPVDHKASKISLIIIVLSTVACAALISMGVYISVKGIISKNNIGTTNESPSIELNSLRVGPVSSDAVDEDKPNRNASNKDKLIKKIRMMFNSLYKSRKKKDDSFVSPPINEEINEIQGPIPHPMPESDDDAVMPSSSTGELEYKLRYEEAERKLNRQAEKISSLRKEMQEEVNSMKRQQTQQQQEMEAKQREMEQQIEFLRSQLPLHRDVPPT